ncbi:MAG: VOC family protein [Pseudonocardiales bacterium]|nr:VOC family protein [Pseudonocardiales bacterium]
MALNPNAPTIYPTLRYNNAAAAITFLTEALGLVTREVHEGPDGRIAHAELSWGTGLVMISSRTDPPGPFDTGICTLYLATDDPDGLHARAVAAGAEIVMELTDQDYGSRDFAVSDPEGNRWCFGTYQPAAIVPAAPS